MYKTVIDATAGNRAIWFNKAHPDAVYVDIRSGVTPDVLADSRALPFPDGSFRIAVFDPPHVNGGANSHISRDYGHHNTASIKQLLLFISRELWRVVVADGVLVFKWNDHDQKLVSVLNLMPEWEPLVGHAVSRRTPRWNSTYWVLCTRRAAHA